EHDQPEHERELEPGLAPQEAQEAACAARLLGRGAGTRQVLDEPIAERLDPPPHVLLGRRAAALDRLSGVADAHLVDAVELLEPALDRLRAARTIHAADLVAERRRGSRRVERFGGDGHSLAASSPGPAAS